MNLKKSIIKERTPEEVQDMLKNKEINIQDIDESLDELWNCCEVNGCDKKTEWIVEFTGFIDPILYISIQAGTVRMCNEHHQSSLNCGNYKSSKKIVGVEK